MNAFFGNDPEYGGIVPEDSGVTVGSGDGVIIAPDPDINNTMYPELRFQLYNDLKERRDFIGELENTAFFQSQIPIIYQNASDWQANNSVAYNNALAEAEDNIDGNVIPKIRLANGGVYLMAGNNGQGGGSTTIRIVSESNESLVSPIDAETDQRCFDTFNSGSRKFSNGVNNYSGSNEIYLGLTGCEAFSYEISFLDKDHTLIVDIDKDLELFDGIGEKGVVIIPDIATPNVKANIEFYLNKAGIIESTTATKNPPKPDL